MLAILLGLGSALCWGTADFFGGLQARRLPVLAVTLWSQLAGGLALGGVLLAGGEPATLGAIAWGVGGGLFVGAALVLFYRGLALGVMSIVAPVSACGAIVPVMVAFALGESPSAVAAVGIAAAIAGIILVSRASESTPHLADGAGTVQAPRGALALALGAALGFGLFLVCLDRGSAAGGSPLWTVGWARVGSLLTLGAMIVLGPRSAPWPGRQIGPVASIGLLDTAANVLFAYASTLGNLGVVAVLASLYPVVPVVLAYLLLAERLARPQAGGVALARAGVAAMSAG